MVLWTIENGEVLMWPVEIVGQSPAMIQVRPAGDLSGNTLWVERGSWTPDGQFDLSKAFVSGTVDRFKRDFPYNKMAHK